MANEREPDDPLPADFVPEGAVATHRVSDGEDWASVAAQYNVKVGDLIYFNFHTNVPAEVNWYLRRNTGCNVSNDGGRNVAFSSSADPGLIYIPPSEVSEVIDMDQQVTDETDQSTGQSVEQPTESDQAETAVSADDTMAFAGGEESAGDGGGGGFEARRPRRPTRPPPALARHDFAVRFTFGTTEPGLLAKGVYLFEIRADDGSRLAARAWSSVSVTVPEVFNFSLSQITRSGEKSPSFDFVVDLRWLPFSTTSSGTPADPNDSDNADKIRKDFRIITTLRPKDNDVTYLTIPSPKGTGVTKVDLHSDMGIVHDVVSAPSTDENDFTLALFKRGVDLDELVERGPPQQTEDGKFLYDVKYYGGFKIEARVLP